MERFFIDAYGPDREAERRGVDWLAEEVVTRGLSGAILVPVVDSISSLARAVGADAADFAKTNRYFTAGASRIEVFTERTKPGYFDGPLLAPWSNDSMVNAAEELSPPAICAIPWAEDDLVQWKRARNPVDLRTGEPVAADAITPSPLVERALVSLTATVNLSTGIHHPSDQRTAKRLFKALYIAGENLEEAEVRTWAIAHGWPPRHAEDLAELVGKIAAGKRVNGAAMNKTEAKAIVARLRA